MKNALVFLIVVLPLVISSCKKTDTEIPTVVGEGVVHITESSAYCEANVSSEGSAPVKTMGFCWNTEGVPTLSDLHTNMAGKKGSFGKQINKLEPYTTYFVRAFATNEHGTAYSNEMQFETGAFISPCSPDSNTVSYGSSKFEYYGTHFIPISDNYEISASGMKSDFSISFSQIPESGIYTTVKATYKNTGECSVYGIFEAGVLNESYHSAEGQKVYITKTGQGKYTAVFCDLIMNGPNSAEISCSGTLVAE